MLCNQVNRKMIFQDLNIFVFLDLLTEYFLDLKASIVFVMQDTLLRMSSFPGQIKFTMGWIYGLKAFTAAILGGIGNIPGAMVGGLLLGVIESLGAAYISVAWKDAIAFVVLILILIVRPTGLLGERVAEKI